MVEVDASQVEVEFKEAFADISKEAQYKRGRRLERALIQSLYEIQEKFDEICLFDVDVIFPYSFGKDYNYKVTLDKRGVRLTHSMPKSIYMYVKRLTRYDQSQSHVQAHNQLTLSKRIAEIYRGILRPMKLEKIYD